MQASAGPPPSTTCTASVARDSKRRGASLVRAGCAHASTDSPYDDVGVSRGKGTARLCIVAESEAELAALMGFCFKRKVPCWARKRQQPARWRRRIRSVVLRWAPVSRHRRDVEAIASSSKPGRRRHGGAHARRNAGAAGTRFARGHTGTVGGSLRNGTREPIARSATSSATCGCSRRQTRSRRGHVQYFYRHTTLARDAVVFARRVEFERGDPGRHPSRDARTAVRRRARNRSRFPTPVRAFETPRATRRRGLDRGGRTARAGARAAPRSRRCTQLHQQRRRRQRPRQYAVLTRAGAARRQERLGVELQLESPRGRVRLMQPR